MTTMDTARELETQSHPRTGNDRNNREDALKLVPPGGRTGFLATNKVLVKFADGTRGVYWATLTETRKREAERTRRTRKKVSRKKATKKAAHKKKAKKASRKRTAASARARKTRSTRRTANVDRMSNTELSALLEKAEYGRHLCMGLAEAGALVDERLVPGLMNVAGYHREDRDYDCRPKWIAVAALARQESDAAVPLLISLVDHGNQNTRHWACAALSRKTGQDFRQDKQAWAQWWQAQGHEPIETELLESWRAPGNERN